MNSFPKNGLLLWCDFKSSVSTKVKEFHSLSDKKWIKMSFKKIPQIFSPTFNSCNTFFANVDGFTWEKIQIQILKNFYNWQAKMAQLVAYWNADPAIWVQTLFHMGIRWHISVTEQVIKSVSQIKWVNNLPSIVCATQRLAN